MKVGVNGRLLSESSMRGWNRYLLNLLFELSKLDVELVIYSERQVHVELRQRLGQLTYRCSGRMPYPYWEQVWLPWAIWRDQIDLFHTPIHYGLPLLTHCPAVMTLHDTISDKYYRDRPGHQLRWGERKIRFHERMARQRANHIITVSNFSKCDIVDYYSISPSNITVIKEAADPRFDGESSSLNLPDDLKGRPYLFYVGGYEERKNISFLIDAFVRLERKDVVLVLAGNHAEFPMIEHPQIVSLGAVDDDILKSLYANARAFIYPSVYEGFGLQLCEAMAMACPVFAANRTSLPEVLGNGGELFNVDTYDELQTLINKVVDDESYFLSLRKKASARSGDFTWQKTASQTLDLYRRLVR